MLIAWLPQARQEQIRRLQVCAQGCDGPVFLCRPAAVQHEPSAAPLRVQLRTSIDWQLHVHLLKRVMELDTSVRLFGGKRKRVERVRDECADLGVRQLSWAPTSMAAVAIARAGFSNASTDRWTNGFP